MRRAGIGIVASAMLLGTAAPSQAATAGVTPYGKYPGGSRLFVQAAPGERNDIVVTRTIDGLRVTDAVPLVAGGWCEPEASGSVLCRPAARTSLGRVGIDLGDLDDSVQVHLDFEATRLLGGAGDDLLIADDTAPVIFVGGTGDDRMVGGLGYDQFLEGPAANGSDLMEGGSAPDSPLDGIHQSDVVFYGDRSDPIRADLAGDRDDGEPGELDHIGSDVESIVGGAADDRLVGDAGPNSLVGGRGADVLRSGAGDDHLNGGSGSDRDRVVAGPGRDYLRGGGGGDALFGGPHADELWGGAGRDLLRPGTGRDEISGGPGDDILWTLDGVLEIVIACDGGHDVVVADRFDQPSVFCERVRSG